MPRRATRLSSGVKKREKHEVEDDDVSEWEEKQWDSDALDDDDKPVGAVVTRSTRSRLQQRKSKRTGDSGDNSSLPKNVVPAPSSRISRTARTMSRHDKDWLDSDALDESSQSSSDNETPPEKVRKPLKRARASPAKADSSSRKSKRRRHAKVESDEGSDSESPLPRLEKGQEIVGVVVQAPKTGLVPPGQISKNTLKFLTKLKDKECNDRQWFKLHEPVFRHAEKEWKDFVDCLTELIIEADPHIPHLPAKDVVHRIYRDVRFSNDKTPYKKNFSASFSRSGRKGIFAGLNPGNESLIAAGSWCPGKNELATIRTNIQRSSRRLRQIISSPDFVSYFGEAKPHPKGKRQNIFGMDDELKIAPKGVEKDHKDIDLLKCRSFAVVYRFADSEVLEPDFAQKVKRVVEVMRPLVHCLNDLMTVGYNEDGDEDENENEDEDEE